MADEIRRSVIEVVAETSGAQQGLGGLVSSFLAHNAAAVAATGALAAAGAGFLAFKAIIERGQPVSEVSAAFENLSQRAGVDATQSLEKLTGATDNLVTKLDLMRASNEALLAGLTPDQFQKVAEAADQLGDAVGVDTKKALDDLTAAMATGVTRGLEKTYGLVIDNKKALEDYAKSHGVAVQALTELGQREAARIAILEALQEQQKATGKANETVGDQFQKLGNIVEDVKNNFARWVNEQPAIVGFFQDLTRGVKVLADALNDLFTTTKEEQLSDLAFQINKDTGNAAAARAGFFPGGEAAAKKFEESAAKAREEFLALLKTFGEVGKTTEENKAGIIDYGKAAEGAAKQADEAFKQWQKDLEGLSGFATRIIDNALNLQIGDSPVGTSANIRIEPLEKGFENAVNFFADLLTPTLEGEAANIEDIFDDMFKRVAIGFGSQLLATVTEEIFPGLIKQLSSLGNAQGLGKEIFGSIFGGGEVNLGFGLSGVNAMIPGIIAAVGAYFVGTNTISGAQDILKGGNLSFAEQAALALPTFGLSFAYNPIKDFFGGDSEKSRQREAREAAIDAINERLGGSFQGVGGPISLNPGNFNVANNNPGTLAGQAVGFANPLGQIFGGGDPKLSEDLAGIFTNAIGTASNFNEVLINTSSLMDALGLDAEDAKNQLAALFLDNKVTLEQFIEGIRNLNVVAGDELVGPNGLADAVNVLGESFESPRVQLKALELIFKDLAKQGIDTSDEIIQAMTEQFGPEIGQVFAELAAHGIDTWEEIKNASVDQLAIIFEALNRLPHEAAAAGEEAGDAIASGISDGASSAGSAIDRLERDFNRLERSANSAGRAARSALNAQSASGNGSNTNTSPNERRP